MKFRQQLKKLRRRNRKTKQEKQLLLLDGSLKKLVDLGIAIIQNGKYAYSSSFEQTVHDIISFPPSKFKQVKLANEAGRKLIPQVIAMATTQTTHRDIENMFTAYVCLKIHIDRQKLEVDKKIVPDLTYAVWYLNDNQPTIEEVESWTLTSQT